MANTHTSLSALFTDIADAIREKTGDTATIVADDFPSVIREVNVGEMCSLTVASRTETTLYYCDESGWKSVTVYEQSSMSPRTVNVKKNSFVLLHNVQVTNISIDSPLSIEQCFASSLAYLFYIKSNGSIRIEYSGGGPI